MLVKQVRAAGTWDDQRVAFERLAEPARSAVWAALTDVRRGSVRFGAPDGPTEPETRGPCQNHDDCGYAPAPRPSPTAKPGTKPSRPPIVTPPRTECDTQTAYVGYEILGEPELYAFVYAGRLSWCYLNPSVTGPLTNYSSFSFAANCCMFPWATDPSRYIDKLTPLPASGTQKIVDHHTGYFYATAKLGPVEAGLVNTPNIDATVIGDGTYVCG